MGRVAKSKTKLDNKQIESDAERWENRELGASFEHAKVVSQNESSTLDLAIDDALGLRSVTIRLQKGLVADFEKFAKEDGIGYQPLIRMVLTRYARDRKGKTK